MTGIGKNLSSQYQLDLAPGGSTAYGNHSSWGLTLSECVPRAQAYTR